MPDRPQLLASVSAALPVLQFDRYQIAYMGIFQRKLATLPLTTYQAGETVLSAASTTGRLLIL